MLACLSACGTGLVRNNAYADENINLISGFLLAGFRHVIGGTLWQVQDSMCVDLARLTYEAMAEGGLCDSSIAWSLNKATRTLRDEWIVSLHNESALKSSVRRNATGVDGPIRNNASIDRADRDVFPAEEEVEYLHWIPYVHFGI